MARSAPVCGRSRRHPPPIKGGVWEFCHILSGVSELIEDGKAPIRVRAGDSFVMKPDYVGQWRCIETTRKIWLIYGSA